LEQSGLNARGVEFSCDTLTKKSVMREDWLKWITSTGRD